MFHLSSSSEDSICNEVPLFKVRQRHRTTDPRTKMFFTESRCGYLEQRTLIPLSHMLGAFPTHTAHIADSSALVRI
eukprot:487341-Amphidinium_carterae.2